MVVTEAIKINKKTKKKLDELKIHPRQSYDEVIYESANDMIIKIAEKNKKLKQEEKKS